MHHVWKPGYGSLPRELLGLFPQVLKFGVVLETDHEIRNIEWVTVIIAAHLTHKTTDTNDTRQHGHIGCTVYVYVIYSLCIYTE